MKEDTVLSDRIDLCRIFIFFSVSVRMCEFDHYGPTLINLGWIFFIFFNILVIITVVYLVFSYVFE